MSLRPLRRGSCVSLACGLLLSSASAQLTDLQPGRNFPNAQAAFGMGRSENLDVGDVDNDGDVDVFVANGGDGPAQANALYINAGGLQAGTEGSFNDESAVRLAGVTIDTSRDAEFGDIDGDGDLDVFISNRGTTTNGGEVSRAYTNQAGLQFGSAGFYTETTDSFWGQLISVDPGFEVGAQDGMGPFKENSPNSEFGDLDDDGDLDLLFASYGFEINGTGDTRVFLNDGQGRFDELWPWVDPGADIRLHTLDVDLVDLDGDFDLDIFGSSRDSQARVYRNNLTNGGGSGALFTDVTQSSLIDAGATVFNTNHYETEFADLDGDGDFDGWAVNYSGFGDRVLWNQGNLTFVRDDTAILGDPSVDEIEADAIDYDGDGDLDMALGNFSGTNSIYQSDLAQGGGPHAVAFHRTGSTTGGSLAPWSETPASGFGGVTLDIEAADLDGDGDADLLLANYGGQQNRAWRNVLGVPDSHAPTFGPITTLADLTASADNVIHALVHDNAASSTVDRYEVDLLYTVNGGPQVTVPMFAQSGQLFRGSIPAALDGAVEYVLRATDDAGNSALSAPTSYLQTSAAASTWQLVGTGTAGVYGLPHLTGSGSLTAGASTRLTLLDAAPSALAALFLSAASAPVAFKGGTLFTFPVGATFNLITGSAGEILLEFGFPSGVPSGLSLWWQYAFVDPLHPSGVALSNALLSTAP